MPRKHRTARVTVIGNAEPVADLSSSIDDADMVVRLNACPHIHSGKIGAKTHVLCLRTFGSVGESFARGESAISPGALAGAEELWFVGEKGDWAPHIIERYKLGNRKHVFLTLRDMREVDRLLGRYGGTERGASLGIMLLKFIADDPRHKNSEIAACCFGFEGWPGHPWQSEKRLFETYCCLGRVHAMDSRPYFDSIPNLAPHVEVVRGASGHEAVGPGSMRLKLSPPMAEVLDLVNGRRPVSALCDMLSQGSAQLSKTFEYEVCRALWRLEDKGLVACG